MTEINNAPTTPKPMKQAAHLTGPDPARVPIRVEKLLFSAGANPRGVTLPEGMEGKGMKLYDRLDAGIFGDIRIEIEWRPWMRHYRVARAHRVTRTEKGKEVEVWEAMGRPYLIPETWAVSIPADDL